MVKIKLLGLEFLVKDIENQRLKKIIVNRLPRDKFNFYGDHTDVGKKPEHTDYADTHIDTGHTDHVDRHRDSYTDGFPHKDYFTSIHNDFSPCIHKDEHKDVGTDNHRDGYRHTDEYK